MANFTTLQKGDSNHVGVGNNDRRIPFHHVIDLADVIAISGFASGDTVTVVKIPANTALVYLHAWVETTVNGDGTTETISIGDTGSTTRFVNGATTLTSGTVLTQVVTTNTLRSYTSADELRLLYSATTSIANTVGKIVITGELMDNNAVNPTTTVAVVNS